MTKEKLIEKYREFTDKQVNLTPREIGLFKDFLLESINEILDSVEPKEMETTDWMGKYSCDVRKGYNYAIADLKDNRKKLGYGK